MNLIPSSLRSILKGLCTVLQKEKAELLPLETQLLLRERKEMPPPESHLASTSGFQREDRVCPPNLGTLSKGTQT